MTLTILEGSTFCICDERGDIGGETTGFFADDTRFLSALRLTVNGHRPLLLSSDKVEYFSAAFFLRNPLAGGLGPDVLSIARERFVGQGMRERLLIRNESMAAATFVVRIEFEADFADIFTVKDRDFSLGDPMHAAPLPDPAPVEWDEEHGQFVIGGHGPGHARTQVILSRPGEVDGDGVAWPVELAPREEWQLDLDVYVSADGTPLSPHLAERHFGSELEHVRDSLSAWQLQVPRLRGSWDALVRSFTRSVADLAALRIRTHPGLEKLPAAGMPWFMTVFGRDTLITSYQTLLFGPELAIGALRALARLQADAHDPDLDAEPGKICHEVRHGKAAERWFPVYYGSADSTPLWLVLLSEVIRWTEDLGLARELHGPAMRALAWIDEWGDRDGDGFVEYERRTPRGLVNQSWKDSGDSQRYSDGRIAEGPIAPCEVQGYVYDAKRRMAELARLAWRDRTLADRLDAEADALGERFNDAFWVDERGGYYALALDGAKRPVDSLTSNIGHLLWSGIVPEDRVDCIVDALAGDALFSGWGVRTMSDGDAGYNPLSYHNGTVWPHDNSLIAAGLARYGRWFETFRIGRRILEASEYFDYQLPEVFAGLPRTETPFPIAYPTAARPQAWAAGTPVLLLQLMLGLRPSGGRHVLESVAPELPSWIGDVRLEGVRAFGRRWDVVTREGRVEIVPA